MNIAILGYGQFGRALGSLLTFNHQDFQAADVNLSLSRPAELLIQAVPTQYMRAALTANAAFLRPETVIINTAKGIEQTSHMLPHQIIHELGFQHYYNLMGPSFASGIVNKDPTLVSLGYSSDLHVVTIQRLLQTPYFRIQPSAHYKALELAGAMKNVYAIICGYAEGMGLGNNTRAKLITIGLQEIATLSNALNLTADMLASGIVGDVVLTCSSTTSRNYQFGKNLAELPPATALERVGATVEGFHTSQSLHDLCEQRGVILPLARLTEELIATGSQGHRLFYGFVRSI